MTTTCSRWFALVFVLVAACSDGPLCVEDDVSITQGVYGQATYAGDVGHPPPHGPLQHVNFTAHLDNPEGPVVATMQSNLQGVYQLALDAGDYWLCTDFLPCTSIRIMPGQLLRMDAHQTLVSAWSPTSPSGCATE